EPARGRKPVLRDESAAVVVKQQYPSERLLVHERVARRSRTRPIPADQLAHIRGPARYVHPATC
ncbi:MAG: hypothetical protein JXA30_17065, partial [Deltaproteobacteria bacterium]|nr:hypothetical protein [Deltaproteobacteria bacterium]